MPFRFRILNRNISNCYDALCWRQRIHLYRNAVAMTSHLVKFYDLQHNLIENRDHKCEPRHEAVLSYAHMLGY